MKVKKDRSEIDKKHIIKVGRRIREVRESLRFIQKEFAAELKMSESYYNQLENGNGFPGYDFFYKLMKKYNVSLDYLFYGIGEMFLKSREKTDLPGEYLEEIESTSDMVWYLERSPIFNQTVMGFANRFLYKNESIIKRNIDRHQKKRDEEIEDED